MAHAQEDDDLAMSTEELLQAQLELYHTCMGFVKSMALRVATDLRIPDAIHRLGGGATLSQLAADIRLHPTKLLHLGRLMRALTISGIFKSSQDNEKGEVVYKLTRVSRLLVGRSSRHLSPTVAVFANTITLNALFSMREWLTDERAAAMSSPVEVSHGRKRWEITNRDDKEVEVFNAGMDADSHVVMEVLLREKRDVFESLSSLVDVGGAHGGAAVAVAKAFPNVKCTVLDLPHVVAGAPKIVNVEFVAGDMFEYIPPAGAVLLKWILHCWQDEDCIKILRRCKEAIAPRDDGGKVIIIDMVVGSAMTTQENISMEAQALLDVLMMYMDGVEREEHQWRKIFLEAGFTEYKITPINGFRSLIEVYP